MISSPSPSGMTRARRNPKCGRVEAFRGGHVRADQAHVVELQGRHERAPLRAAAVSRAPRAVPPIDADLRQQADHVGPVPARGDLAVHDPEHRDLGEVHGLAAGRDGAGRRDHRSRVRALLAKPPADRIALGDLDLDVDVEVRERGQEHARDHLRAGRSRWQAGRARALVVGREELVGDVQLALVPELLDDPVEDGLVLLDGGRRATGRPPPPASPPGPAGGGVAPGAGGWIWAISPSASNSCQRAMTCGPRKRKIAQPVQETLLPVAAMP